MDPPKYPKEFLNWKTVIVNIGTLGNVVLYQGLILRLFLFVWYEVYPQKISPATSFYENLDARDMLIIIDITLFVSMIFSLLLFLLGALITDERSLMCVSHLRILHKKEFTEKDFMETNLVWRLGVTYWVVMGLF